MRAITPEQKVAKFWSRVDKSGACWLWTGPTLPNGYGRCTSPTQLDAYTHRFSWEMAHGAIPDGLCVLHRCDVRNCVNPAHLFLGTYADNNHDMRAKGREYRRPKHAVCARGHARVGRNVQMNRSCRQCTRDNENARRARRVA